MRISYGAGLNENQFPHPSEAGVGSYNFDLKKDSSYLFPRMPFDLMGTATGGGAIRGIMQLVKRDDTVTTLLQAGGSVLKWDGATTYSQVATVTSVSQLRDTYWSLGDYLVVTDLQRHTQVSKWDGTTFVTLTTGLGSSLFAKYAIVHQGRMWLFNVKTSSDTPHLMVASAFENPESYDITKRAVSGTFTTGSEAFYMLTPDLRPINGVALTLSGDLVISTKEGRLFKLTGSDSRDYKWVDFYANSAAIGDESIVSAGNDIFYMRKGAAIESLLATQNYGDVAADDVSRWIPETVKNLTGGRAVYDQQNQKVLWFLDNGKVLVLFKDLYYGGCVVDESGAKQKLSPWSVYRTSHGSNFSVSAVKYMRVPGNTDNFSVIFGDSSGRIYNLNGIGDGDASGTDITLVRKTRFLGKESGLDYTKKIPRGKIRYERTEQCTLDISLEWGDEYNTSTASVTLDGATSSGSYFGGSVYFGGSFYFNSGSGQAGFKSHINTSFVGRGSVVTKTVSATNRVRYHVDHIELL